MLTIATDSMDLAGDLVQSLGSYLGIEVSGGLGKFHNSGIVYFAQKVLFSSSIGILFQNLICHDLPSFVRNPFFTSKPCL